MRMGAPICGAAKPRDQADSRRSDAPDLLAAGSEDGIAQEPNGTDGHRAPRVEWAPKIGQDRDWSHCSGGW
jgi:hypothetical protein